MLKSNMTIKSKNTDVIIGEKQHAPVKQPWLPANELWRIVPKRDDKGRYCADFMMLLPGLKKANATRKVQVYGLLQSALDDFGEQILFAEVNLKLNSVWVSVVAKPGLCSEVASVIHEKIPDALLVGGQLAAHKKLSPWSRLGHAVVRMLTGIPQRALQNLLPYRQDNAER